MNHCSPEGRTALMVAAQNIDLNLTNLLLDNGADVNMQLPKKHVALMWPAEKGQEKMARLLLDRGANPEAKNMSKMTALDSVYLYFDNCELLRGMFRKAENDNLFDKVDLSYFAIACLAEYDKKNGTRFTKDFQHWNRKVGKLLRSR